jgi:hypothetical protein
LAICALITDGFIYALLASLSFDPLTLPLTGLLIGFASGFTGQIYYVAVWGVSCKFCKSVTPTETGRCAICLAPLDADPSTFNWEPAPRIGGPLPGPGPHGDRGAVERGVIRWRGNKNIFAREVLVFFLELIFLGLLFEEFLYDSAMPPTGSAGKAFLLFLGGLVVGLFRPTMNRRLRKVFRNGRHHA